MRYSLAIALSLALASPAFALDVALSGKWDGKRVPAGQQCNLDGGKGKTPPMTVSNIPDGTVWLQLEFNDKDYKPLSRKGGHGILAYQAKGATTKIPALPGLTAKMPKGAVVVSKARSKGDYASPGYLPPCSGGRGHRYTVDVKAVDGAGKVLASAKNIKLGRY